MKVEAIKLNMDSRFDPPDPETGQYTKRQLEEIKLGIIGELVELLDLTGKVSNTSKLKHDLTNREKKASTAIGQHIAIPHVRTMQAKQFVMAIGRNSDGYEFEAPDHLPVKMFFCMAAPPYDDALYLKVFKTLASRFQMPGFIDNLLTEEDPNMIIRLFKELE